MESALNRNGSASWHLVYRCLRLKSAYFQLKHRTSAKVLFFFKENKPIVVLEQIVTRLNLFMENFKELF